jgi:hypothetical protein
MKAKMTIEMDNSAFEDPQEELKRIFLDLADRIEFGRIDHPYAIWDINGNVIGELNVK